MLMRKNVNNDVSNDSPIDIILFSSLWRWTGGSTKFILEAGCNKRGIMRKQPNVWAQR